MGFFEHGGKLWPKVFSLKLDLIVDPKPPGQDFRLIDVFSSDGKISGFEITNGTWPFGVKTL